MVDPAAQKIYMVNCLSALEHVVAGHACCASRCQQLNAQISAQVSALVASQAGSLLNNSGLAEVADRIRYGNFETLTPYLFACLGSSKLHFSLGGSFERTFLVISSILQQKHQVVVQVLISKSWCYLSHKIPCLPGENTVSSSWTRFLMNNASRVHIQISRRTISSCIQINIFVQCRIYKHGKSESDGSMATDQALAAEKIVRALKSFATLLSQPQAQPEFRSLQACSFS